MILAWMTLSDTTAVTSEIIVQALQQVTARRKAKHNLHHPLPQRSIQQGDRECDENHEEHPPPEASRAPRRDVWVIGCNERHVFHRCSASQKL